MKHGALDSLFATASPPSPCALLSLPCAPESGLLCTTSLRFIALWLLPVGSLAGHWRAGGEGRQSISFLLRPYIAVASLGVPCPF